MKLFYSVIFLMFVSVQAEILDPKIPKTCEDFLGSLSAVKASATDRSDIENDEEISVAIVATKKGNHGGSLYTVSKIGESWASSVNTMGADVQGNPKWFTYLLDKPGAEYFGFKLIDEKTMQVPDYQEIRGAVKKLNEYLLNKGIDPLPVGFYLQKKTNILSYINAFVKKGFLPIAEPAADLNSSYTAGNPADNHFFHDVSFHLGAILAPPKVIAHRRNLTHYHQSFFAWLVKNSIALKGRLGMSDEQWAFFVRKLEIANNQESVRVIDLATAMITMSVISYETQKDKVDSPSAFVGGQLEVVSGAAISPKNRLKTGFMNYIFTHVNNPKVRGFLSLGDSNILLNPAFGEAIVEQFDEIYVPMDSEFLIEVSFASSYGEACRDFSKRRLTIMKAIQDLQEQE